VARTIYAAEADAFDGDELRLLVELAGIGALRARADGEAATQALRQSTEATITALASTVEFRDPYTARPPVQCISARGCDRPRHGPGNTLRSGRRGRLSGLVQGGTI
jgi:hypothetical protein